MKASSSTENARVSSAETSVGGGSVVVDVALDVLVAVVLVFVELVCVELVFVVLDSVVLE